MIFQILLALSFNPTGFAADNVTIDLQCSTSKFSTAAKAANKNLGILSNYAQTCGKLLSSVLIKKITEAQNSISSFDKQLNQTYSELQGELNPTNPNRKCKKCTEVTTALDDSEITDINNAAIMASISLGIPDFVDSTSSKQKKIKNEKKVLSISQALFLAKAEINKNKDRILNLVTCNKNDKDGKDGAEIYNQSMVQLISMIDEATNIEKSVLQLTKNDDEVLMAAIKDAQSKPKACRNLASKKK